MAEGVRVIGLSRSPEIDDAPEGMYLPVSVDLSDMDALPEKLDALFAEHSGIDLVINNAGYGILEYFDALSDAQIEQQLAVMLRAPTLLAGRAIRTFREQKVTGCLVNVSSLAAELPLPLMPIYNMCKAGLSALSDSLLLDGSKTGEGPVVIDFRPGDFNTNFAQRMEGLVDWQGVDLRAVMDAHHAKAPEAAVAVEGLAKALRKGVSGRVRVGEFFQAKVAPLGPRLFPNRWLRGIIRNYYKH